MLPSLPRICSYFYKAARDWVVYVSSNVKPHITITAHTHARTHACSYQGWHAQLFAKGGYVTLGGAAPWLRGRWPPSRGATTCPAVTGRLSATDGGGGLAAVLRVPGRVGEAHVALRVGVVEELEVGRKNWATYKQWNSRKRFVFI